VKEETNKYIEIVKKSNWNSKNEYLTIQTNNLFGSLKYRLNKIEERITELEDQVDALQHWDEDKAKT
jgi:DNA gyrase/topoisomerase IV subunit A